MIRLGMLSLKEWENKNVLNRKYDKKKDNLI